MLPKAVSSAAKNIITKSYTSLLLFYYSSTQMQHQKGFVIDIDGTIVHHGQPLEPGTKTLNYLNQHNIPFLLLTNNCHSSQKQKADEITQMLKLEQPLRERQVVLNYTPVKKKFSELDGLVLVVGREKRLRDILPLPEMEKYITVGQFCSIFPEVVPLAEQYTEQMQKQCIERLKKRLGVENINKYELKVGGVIILTTPINWEEAIQVIMDLCSTSDGKISNFHSYELPQKYIPVIACYNDLYTVSKGNTLPRLLMQPFIESLKTVFKLVYKEDLKIEMYGKPHASSYNFARSELEEMYGPIGQMCMIGDNIDSDIRGPLEIGWDTILVKTGVNKVDFEKSTVNAEDIWSGVRQYLKLDQSK